MSKKILKFPEGFLWGASVSAHQVEGGNLNDWVVWEEGNADRLSNEADGKYKSYVPDWEDFRFQASRKENYISGKACDFYNRYKRDILIIEELNFSAFRLSIEWSRVEPKVNEFDMTEVEYYRDLLRGLKEKGIKTFVTIWHWTLPLWLARDGGVESKVFVERFSKYAEKIFRELNEYVDFWITINEPLGWAANSYIVGKWPPGSHNPLKYFRVVNNLLEAHKLIYTKIKDIDKNSKVGISKIIVTNQAYKGRVFNKLLKAGADYFGNNYFLDRIKSFQDFIGVNHYFYNLINYAFGKQHNEVVSDLGWGLFPDSLYHAVKEVEKYKIPIYVTEHGLADAADSNRSWYLTGSLKFLQKAILEGTDVKGYLHWSFMDNFEWEYGFWPRFGLVEIDYEDNLKRIVRPSAKVYSKVIQRNGVLC